MESTITKKHIEENGYGFNVYYDGNGEECGRAGTGMTKEEKARVDAELLFAFLDVLAEEGLTWAGGRAKYASQTAQTGCGAADSPVTSLREGDKPTKTAPSRYDGYSKENIMEQCEAKLIAAKEKIEQLKASVKALSQPIGTNMTQSDYIRLTDISSSKQLTKEEAILLVNREFGFEATRIEVLPEAEIGTAEDGTRLARIKKLPRPPMYAATDWNYIRFNIYAASEVRYFEMINSQLRPVLL
jgi:hypothetical protein